MVPIIARAGEVALRVVPERAARGQPRAGRHALADGAQGRAAERPGRPGHGHDPRAWPAAIGETAVLLITSGASSFLTFNPTANR